LTALFLHFHLSGVAKSPQANVGGVCRRKTLPFIFNKLTALFLNFHLSGAESPQAKVGGGCL